MDHQAALHSIQSLQKAAKGRWARRRIEASQQHPGRYRCRITTFGCLHGPHRHSSKRTSSKSRSLKPGKVHCSSCALQPDLKSALVREDNTLLLAPPTERERFPKQGWAARHAPKGPSTLQYDYIFNAGELEPRKRRTIPDASPIFLWFSGVSPATAYSLVLPALLDDLFLHRPVPAELRDPGSDPKF